jgi:hypothetical protein
MGVTSGQTKTFRGFAYVIMEEKESADALINLERLKFKNSTVIVKKCRDQEKDEFSEGKNDKRGETANSHPIQKIKDSKDPNEQKKKGKLASSIQEKSSIHENLKSHLFSDVTPITKSTGFDFKHRINHPYFLNASSELDSYSSLNRGTEQNGFSRVEVSVYYNPYSAREFYDQKVQLSSLEKIVP